MKYILTADEIEVPQGVDVQFRSREVTVKGPLGTLKRNFRFLNFDGRLIRDPATKRSKIRVRMWFAKRKQRALVNTVLSQIKNLFRGVQTGYRFKMKTANRHFPIHTVLNSDGTVVEVKNFIGEKIVRRVELLPGVKASKTEEAKDEITLQGPDLNNVSLSCALINQSMKVAKKDLRKFLDGIYVSEKRLDMVQGK